MVPSVSCSGALREGPTHFLLRIVRRHLPWSKYVRYLEPMLVARFNIVLYLADHVAV